MILWADDYHVRPELKLQPSCDHMHRLGGGSDQFMRHIRPTQGSATLIRWKIIDTWQQ